MGVSLCLMKMAMTVTVSRIPPQATHIGTMASNESHRMYCISKSKHPRLSSYGHRPGPQSAHLNSFSTYSHGSQRSQLQQQVSPCKSNKSKSMNNNNTKNPTTILSIATYLSIHIMKHKLIRQSWTFCGYCAIEISSRPNMFKSFNKHPPRFQLYLKRKLL